MPHLFQTCLATSVTAPRLVIPPAVLSRADVGVGAYGLVFYIITTGSLESRGASSLYYVVCTSLVVNEWREVGGGSTKSSPVKREECSRNIVNPRWRGCPQTVALALLYRTIESRARSLAPGGRW